MRKGKTFGPVEVDHRKSLSLLRATLESTADGVLVVDNLGKITTYNQQFAEMWRIPASVLASGDDEVVLGHVIDQVKHPEQFRKKVRDLYDHPGQESFDTIQFKDGRIFERYSRPQLVVGQTIGRVPLGGAASPRDASPASRGEVRRARIGARIRTTAATGGALAAPAAAGGQPTHPSPRHRSLFRNHTPRPHNRKSTHLNSSHR